MGCMDSVRPTDALSRLAPAGRPELADRALEQRFAALIDSLRRNRPEDDVDLLRRAFDFAVEKHGSQMRRSGEPYVSHPLEVAQILADLRLDVSTLCAALLHDVVEDTLVPLTVVSEKFGGEIARLVEGVTKISRLELLSPEVRQVESVRKMLLAMVSDVRSRPGGRARRPPPQHAHFGLSRARKAGAHLARKRSISTRPLPIV